MNTSTKTVRAHEKRAMYENNPILLVLAGIERLFSYTRSTAFVLLVAAIVLGLLNAVSMSLESGSYTDDTTGPSGGYGTPSSALGAFLQLSALAPLLGIVGIVATALVLMLIFFVGIADHSAAQAAKGRKASFADSVRAVSVNFWPYALLRVLVFVKTVAWALLFIIPGIYFGYRYALSGVVFFAEDKKGMEAVKRSLALTKNAWMTTFVSYGLVNILTFGFVQLLSDTATGSELYRSFQATVDKGLTHPRPHLLTKLFLAGLISLVALALLAAALFAMGDAVTQMTPDPFYYE